MNEHQLHDAFSALDDDLIEETDIVRDRKQRPRRLLPLICRIGAAACACFVVGLSAFHLMTPDDKTNDTAPQLHFSQLTNGSLTVTDDTCVNVGSTSEEHDYGYVGEIVDGGMHGDNGYSDIAGEPSLRGDEFELYPPLGSDIADEPATEMISGIVLLWGENGFSLTIGGSSKTDERLNVFITLTEDTVFTATDGETVTRFNRPPTAADLPIGTYVTVIVSQHDETGVYAASVSQTNLKNGGTGYVYR